MQQNGAAILIVSGEVKIFSDFFLKAATQRGVVLEITPVEGSFGEFGELAHRVL